MSDDTSGSSSDDAVSIQSFVVIMADDVDYVRRHLAHFAGGQIFIESLQIARL